MICRISIGLYAKVEMQETEIQPTLSRTRAYAKTLECPKGCEPPSHQKHKTHTHTHPLLH